MCAGLGSCQEGRGFGGLQLVAELGVQTGARIGGLEGGGDSLLCGAGRGGKRGNGTSPSE